MPRTLTRAVFCLLLGLLWLRPAPARAADGDVEVPADRLAAELGSRIARALKVHVTVEPSDRIPFIGVGAPGQLLYNADVLVRLEQAHGQQAIAGLVAYWIALMKNPQGGPLLAEAHTGCAFARIGMKHQGYQRALAVGAFGAGAGTVGPGRTSALVQGYLNCLMGQEPRVPEGATRAVAAAAAPSAPRLAPAMAPFTARQAAAKRKR